MIRDCCRNGRCEIANEVAHLWHLWLLNVEVPIILSHESDIIPLARRFKINQLVDYSQYIHAFMARLGISRISSAQQHMYVITIKDGIC